VEWAEHLGGIGSSYERKAEVFDRSSKTPLSSFAEDNMAFLALLESFQLWKCGDQSASIHICRRNEQAGARNLQYHCLG